MKLKKLKKGNDLCLKKNEECRRCMPEKWKKENDRENDSGKQRALNLWYVFFVFGLSMHFGFFEVSIMYFT